MESSFKKMPEQFDWAFMGMILYCAYIFLNSSILVACFSLLVFLILLNGWISSRATSSLYSDFLLAVDLIAMCSYFAMVYLLGNSENKIDPKFWLACGSVTFSYLLWDIAVMPLVGAAEWKKRFRSYVVLMFFSTVLFIVFYFLHIAYQNMVFLLNIAGAALWLGLLAKWHRDKIKDSKKKNEQNV